MVPGPPTLEGIAALLQDFLAVSDEKQAGWGASILLSEALVVESRNYGLTGTRPRQGPANTPFAHTRKGAK